MRPKPPEYARFGLLIDVFLLVVVFAAAGQLQSTRARRAVAAAIVVFVIPFAVPYIVAFVRDASPHPSRLVAARTLKSFINQGATTVRVSAEPAPYNTPIPWAGFNISYTGQLPPGPWPIKQLPQHPVTGQEIIVTAEVPKDFNSSLTALRKWAMNG